MYSLNRIDFQTYRLIRERLISSSRLITSEHPGGGDFVQLRSEREIEALLQGTLGNNNAYLEKKKI